MDIQTKQKLETMKLLLFADLHMYDAAYGLKKIQAVKKVDTHLRQIMVSCMRQFGDLK